MEDQEQNVRVSELASNIVAKNCSKKSKIAKNVPASTTLGIEDIDMEVEDLLKTLSHQKSILTPRKWQLLNNMHSNFCMEQSDFTYFVLIATQANFRILQQPGYYQRIREIIGKYPISFFSCIDKDVPRTVSQTHPFYHQIRNILCCYAIRNPSVHYCQGMNYIVAFLLMNNLSEQQSFWFLVQMIENILMPDYFKDLSKVSITTQIFTDILEHAFPQFYTEIVDLGMDPSIFTVGWYVCLFTKGFINSVSIYLLEYLILQSRQYPVSFVLLKASLAVVTAFLTNEKPFQFDKDYSKLKDTIDRSVNEISLNDIKSALNYFNFDLQQFEELYDFYSTKREQNYAQLVERELDQKRLTLPSCQPESPICMHRIEIQKKVGEIEEVLILKSNNQIADIIDQDYFPNKVLRGPQIPKLREIEQCLITHHKHICSHVQYKQVIPSICLPSQQSDYFPVCEINKIEPDYNSLQQERVSRYSNVEDIYTRFSSYFIVDDADDEKIGETSDTNQEKQNLLETSLQRQFDIQKNRYARVVLDEPQDKQIEDGGSKYSKYNLMGDSISYAVKRAIGGMKLLRSKNQTKNR